MSLSTDIATMRALKANVETLSKLNINQAKTIEELQAQVKELQQRIDAQKVFESSWMAQRNEMAKKIEQLEGEVLDLKAVDEMRCIGLENKRIRINKQNAYIEQLEADAPRILTDTIDSQAQAIKVMRERIEKLEADSVHGWRSCIDHIIKPDSPCPVCRVEELEAEIEGMHEDAAGDSI